MQEIKGSLLPVIILVLVVFVIWLIVKKDKPNQSHERLNSTELEAIKKKMLKQESTKKVEEPPKEVEEKTEE